MGGWCVRGQAAIRQSFMPTAVKWLPSGLGYFLNLSFTAALFINILGCIWWGAPLMH